MREIKFRVWDYERKRMVLLNKPLYNSIRGSIDMQTQDVLSGNWKLLEYTGLKDKNGKEIYEGDICRGKKDFIYNTADIIFFIEFRNGAFRPNKTSHMRYYKQIEVIGNIYENEELIKYE